MQHIMWNCMQNGTKQKEEEELEMTNGRMECRLGGYSGEW